MCAVKRGLTVHENRNGLGYKADPPVARHPAALQEVIEQQL